MTEQKADRSAPAILSTVCKYARPYLFLWLLCLCPLQAVQAAPAVHSAQTVHAAHQDSTTGAVSPRTPAISLEEAVALYESGQRDRAHEAFLRILDDQPEEPVVLYHLGHLDPDREAAEQYFLKVLLHGPEHPLADDALLEVSRIQFALERHDDAVNACNRLLAAYPDSDLEDEARFLLGQALLAGRRPELSRMVFRQLLAAKPDSTLVRSARLAIAESYRAQEDFIEAARQYLKFEIDFQGMEGLETVLWEAGQCLEAAGRTVEAGFVYQRLIKRYPDSPEANRARVERPLLE